LYLIVFFVLYEDKGNNFFWFGMLFGTLRLLTEEENKFMVDYCNWITSAKFSLL